MLCICSYGDEESWLSQGCLFELLNSETEELSRGNFPATNLNPTILVVTQRNMATWVG